MAEVFDLPAFTRQRRLRSELQQVGFSTRAINALVYGTNVSSIEDLRSRRWGSPTDQYSLCFELSRVPNLGQKGLAEVLAFREGNAPRSAHAPVTVSVSVPMDAEMIGALDGFIAKQPGKIKRPAAIRALVAAGLRSMGET
jgi:hypothetical protein